MTIGTTQGKQWIETLPTDRGALFTGRTFCRMHMRGKALPTVGEIWATSNHAGEGHSHDADELLYVLSGAIEINEQRVATGDVAFIPRRSHYTVSGCNLSDNTASIDGGGIDNQGRLNISTSTLAQNSAQGDGGGIYMSVGSASLPPATSYEFSIGAVAWQVGSVLPN